MTEGNHLNSSEYVNNSEHNKAKKFVENTKMAIRKALTASGIAASTMGPIATTTTPTLIPASVNTITAVAPITTTVKTISLGAAASLLAACGDDEPDGPIDVKDTVAPTINVNQTEVDITGGKQIRIEGNQLYIGDVLVASRNDNVSKNCKVSLSMNGKTITSGTTLSEEGTLSIKVTDDAGNEKSSNIKLNIAKNAPSITVNKSEVNVFGGEKVSISDNQLLIGDDIVVSRKCDGSEIKSVSLKFNEQEIKSGDTLNTEGKLVITVTSDAGKTATTEINITNDAIYGLENLKNVSIQVDKEIDLLEGITFAEGVELVKLEVEIDGKRITISDPKHYTPEYPGTINVIFTLKGKNGNTAEVIVDNLTIKPLDYTTPSIESANPIKDYFSRYNNLTPKTKEFIYHHLLTSYLCMDRYKQDNLEYILAGELPASFECENVGNPNSYPGDHADQGYSNLKHLAPNSNIKACSGNWQYLEDYINQHPDKVFMVSCASDYLGGNTLEDLKNNPRYSILKRILGKENIVINCALGNRDPPRMKIIEENSAFKDGGTYSSASVTSDKNNKIAVVGYNPNQQNVLGDDNQSCIPVGFGKGNIVVPFIPLTDWTNNQELSDDTRSSYPTAAESGSLGNFLSIIIHTHPGITLEDAMTIMVDNYLREETFKYKNDEGNIVDGDKWYFFDTTKFLDNEILHKSDIDAIQLNWDDVQLPSHEGLCYTGKGIQFEYKGNRYDITNQSKLNEAIKSGDIKRYWNKKAFKKYGGTNSANFDVYVIDQSGKKIPDLHLSINKSVN